MENIAIKVENLSKFYRLGAKEEVKDSMVATIVNAIRSPLNNYRKYRSLYDFSDIDSNSANILHALQDVSFEVRVGERIGIIGGNGAGKSTLLKILSRITPPSSGSASIKGRVSSLLEVGTGFHPELTGRENVYLNGTILGMRKKEVDQKFAEIVEFSGVEQFLDTPVKRYSSGMRVRLAFAVAAHLEPEILIVDEVLAVGDADFQHKCLNKMKSVASSGRTVLFVSHNMGAITQLCERALWLEHGRLRQQGPVEDVINSYLSDGSSGQSVWEPGEEDNISVNSSIKIISAKLTNSFDGVPSTMTDFGSPLELEIKYEILKPSRNIQVLYRVTDMNGNVLYTSVDTDSPNTHGQMREAGRYTSVSSIASYLKPGGYKVSLGVRDGPKRLDEYENVLTFDVSTQGCELFPVNRKGFVMPTFDWQVQCLPD